MRTLFILSALALGACATSGLKAPKAARSLPWQASVVDLAPAAVKARLGPPLPSEERLPGMREDCFRVAPPVVSRCVTYVDGLALSDTTDIWVPAADLVSRFDALVTEVSSAVGAPETRVHFAFTPGEDVFLEWKERGFRFGESCIFESAIKKGTAAPPEALDAPGFAAAVASGSACLRASWPQGSGVYSHGIDGPDAPAGMYRVTVGHASQDAARRKRYQDAADNVEADLNASLNRLEELLKEADSPEATEK